MGTLERASQRLLHCFDSMETELFIASFIVYLLSSFTTLWMPKFQFTGTSTTWLHLATMRALLEDHSFVINRFLQPGQIDVSYHAGNYYCAYAPGTQLIILPIYLLYINFFPSWAAIGFGRPILQLPIIFCASLSVVIVYKFCNLLGASKLDAAMTAAAYAFGTILWSFTKRFSHHHGAALLLVSSAYLAVRYVKRGGRRYDLAASGFLAGISTLFEIPGGLLFLFLAVYLGASCKSKWRYVRQLATIAVPFIAGLIPIGVYNYELFGHPLAFSEAKLTRYPFSQYGYLHGIQLPESSPASSWDFISKLIKIPPVDAVYGLTLSPFRGIFFYSPVLLLALPGFYIAYKKGSGKEALLFLMSFVWSLFFFSNWHTWWGGSSYGPRFLISVTSFLIIPLSFTIDYLRHRRLIMIFLILFSLSAVFSGAGILHPESPAGFSPEVKNPIFDVAIPSCVTYFSNNLFGGKRNLIPTPLIFIPILIIIPATVLHLHLRLSAQLNLQTHVKRALKNLWIRL